MKAIAGWISIVSLIAVLILFVMILNKNIKSQIPGWIALAVFTGSYSWYLYERGDIAARPRPQTKKVRFNKKITYINESGRISKKRAAMV